MSLIPKSLPKMRIIAIPLTRPNPSVRVDANPRRILTFYHFQMSSPKPQDNEKPAVAGTGGRPARLSWLPDGGVMKFLQSKAADTWASFGKAKEGSWQLKVHQMGESLVDRMDFEELALKGVDPSLGPSLLPHSANLEKESRIPLIYPSSLSSDSETLLHLKTMLQHRTPRHRRGFYMWMIIAPFTAPLAIIPVIPNLPFFFCVWRSWSHYKAYRATQYLENLLLKGAIVPEGNETLNGVFKKFSVSTPSSSEESATNGQGDELLLTRDAVPTIIDLLELKQSDSADLNRAMEQARLRIADGRLGSS